jgi:hypothetical protein
MDSAKQSTQAQAKKALRGFSHKPLMRKFSFAPHRGRVEILFDAYFIDPLILLLFMK